MIDANLVVRPSCAKRCCILLRADAFILTVFGKGVHGVAACGLRFAIGWMDISLRVAI